MHQDGTMLESNQISQVGVITADIMTEAEKIMESVWKGLANILFAKTQMVTMSSCVLHCMEFANSAKEEDTPKNIMMDQKENFQLKLWNTLP